MALKIPDGLILQSLNVTLSFDEVANVTNAFFNVSVKNEKDFVKSFSGSLSLDEKQQDIAQNALSPVFDAITAEVEK